MIKNKVLVAGYICLDILPELPEPPKNIADWFSPGQLFEIGPSRIAIGGAVANTGIALRRLGVPARLFGKIGADPFGDIVQKAVGDEMLRDPNGATAYSFCLAPGGRDRVFWSHEGSNETLTATDFPDSLFADACWMHFGYPPLMRQFFINGGRELATLFRRAKEAGVTTSLDMTLPDPASESGRVDWREILSATLPFVDYFTPSLEETAFMLDKVRGMSVREAAAAGDPLGGLTIAQIESLADELIAMGAGAVMLKLGSRGAIVKTKNGEFAHEECFRVNVVCTTGSGDSTIAGFIAAILNGLPPTEALRMAVAVGASAVENPNVAAGLPKLEEIAARVKNGWQQHNA